jgi:hypothetical protein
MRRAVLAVCLAAACTHGVGQIAPRTLIRVGLWTLWHDQQATITPINGATMRAGAKLGHSAPRERCSATE